MPSNYGPLQTFTAENDLRTKQFYIVELSGDNQIDVADAATDRGLGVLHNKPNSGEAAAVMTLQGARTPAAMDGTTDIAANDLLGPNSSGVLVKKATADYSVCAIACEACTTNGVEIHDVIWLGPAYFRTAAD
jgi:hypothetical protein